MKIKTLLLSTVTAAGLSSAALAADPAALTSLDVCDALGITGLTISSDSNCLQISGGVTYEFNWGDYNGTDADFAIYTVADNDDGALPGTDDNQDWSSSVDAWLKFVGTADSDYGPAKATIKLGFDEDSVVTNETAAVITPVGGSRLVVDEAWVSVGDSTVLMAGKKGSIASLGHDKGFDWLGLKAGQDFGLGGVSTGGHVIQLTSDLGNGVDVALGLEDLAGNGSLIGSLNYAGDTLAAHITFGADDVLTGAIREWAVHAGAEVTVDTLKFLAAVGFQSVDGFAQTGWNVMASAQATFDMFVLAASVSASNDGASLLATTADNLAVSGSIAADVTDTVTIKLGAQWTDADTTTASDEEWKVAAQLSAVVTENVTLVAEAGLTGEQTAPATSVAYASVEAKWAPGGGFTSSVKGWGNANGAYKVTFKAAKSF